MDLQDQLKNLFPDHTPTELEKYTDSKKIYGYKIIL